jgi:membrane-bound serine protease (ClpP class)
VLLVIALALAFFVLPAPLGIALVVLAAAFEIGEIVFWRRWLSRYRVSTGAEGLVGMAGEVVERLDPEGGVKVRGELWRARSPQPAKIGEKVTVRGVDGLTLEVEPETGHEAQ